MDLDAGGSDTGKRGFPSMASDTEDNTENYSHKNWDTDYGRSAKLECNTVLMTSMDNEKRPWGKKSI